VPGDDRIQLADSDRFLAPSKSCDADHPAIREAALSLGRSRDSEREKAIGVFHLVRDQVLFQFSRFSDTASDTLTSKRGHCYQKANLQIALLRCLGIPAGFITQRIDPNVLRPFLSDEAMKIIGERVGHSNACAFLNGRWVSADATFDKPLLDFVLDDPWQMQETWDGIQDVKLPAHLLIGEPSEPLAAIWIPEELRDRTPQQNLVLNQRLLAIRAQMEAQLYTAGGTVR
jgi:transglutaminase-like putative cysteine protease